MDTGKVKLEKPEPEITLCVGAQVMVTRNIDIANGICNGTIGIVKNIMYKGKAINGSSGLILNAVNNAVKILLEITIGKYKKNITLEVFKFEQINSNGSKSATRCQVPLQLAYAISIHKSQGLTLNKAVISLDKCFAGG